MIAVDRFTGEYPRTPPHLLPAGAATEARDCDFVDGSLRGLASDDPVAGISGAGVKSLFVYDGGAASGTTFLWGRDVDAVRSPIANDAFARFYWSDGSGFYVSRGDIGGGGEPSNSNRYKVGVPRPPGALAARSTVLSMPGVTGYHFELFDERADGSLANGVTVSGELVLAATSAKLPFSQRPPAPIGQNSPDNPSFVGPVVKVTLFRQTGNLTAMVRADSNKTSWPVELPGYAAYLSSNGGNYELVFACKADSVERRAYTYTYVNQYGEEGAPAEPFVLDCAEHATVDLTYALPPDGYCPCTRIRVYRTASGVATDYLYVGEVVVNAGNPTFTDSVRNDALGHTLDTHNYYPPSQGLRGICSMSNGIIAGFMGNEVHFMEPYLPYACNPSAIKPFPHRVIGICPFEGGLYVTTTAGAHVVQGAAPEYMTDMRLPVNQGGVSKGSITNYNGQIVYASNDGLVMAQGMQASLDLSFRFFSRETWRARFGNKLSNMRLNAHDGSLLVWFDDGTPGCLIRFEDAAPSLTRMTQGYFAAFQHPVADTLYVSDGTRVFDFRAGAKRKLLLWHSKDFILPKPTSFGVLQLIGSGELGFAVYADGEQKYAKTVNLDDKGFATMRLPSGFLARRWSFKLAGGGEVREAYLATTMAELKHA